MALIRRGRFWHYDFEYRKQRFQGSTDQTNRTKAKLVESKIRSDVALEHFGIGPPKASPNLKDFLEGRFLEFCRRHAKKDRTAKFWAEKSRRLVAYTPFADARLSAIDEDAIESYKAHRLKSVSVTAVNRELACLRKALNLAYEWKLVAHKPRVRQLPGEKVRTFVVSADLETAYLNAAEYPLKQAAVLMLDLGLRPEEVVSLRKADIVQECVFVRGGKSANAIRTLPLTSRSKDTIELCCALFPNSEWLLPGKKKGTHITRCALDCMHARLRERAKLHAQAFDPDASIPIDMVTSPIGVLAAMMPADASDFVLHTFRHTYATRLAESGASAWDMQRLLGHSSITITQRYVHITTESMVLAQKRAEAFGKMLRGEVQDLVSESSLGRMFRQSP